MHPSMCYSIPIIIPLTYSIPYPNIARRSCSFRASVSTSEKLEGEGPETGWVSIRLKGKELLVPLDAENVVARKPAATSKSLKRPYAIAVVGATGFTGRLMVEHLDALFTGGHAKESSKTWVIAGRNLKRLQALASSCSTVPEVLVADSEASLEEVARQCIVLVAAAGPFSQCGGNGAPCLREEPHALRRHYW